MTVFLLMMLTAFVSMICGAIMLIQIGGWLPILVAILLIIQWIAMVMFIIAYIIGSIYSKSKEEKQ